MFFRLERRVILIFIKFPFHNLGITDSGPEKHLLYEYLVQGMILVAIQQKPIMTIYYLSSNQNRVQTLNTNKQTNQQPGGGKITPGSATDFLRNDLNTLVFTLYRLLSIVYMSSFSTVENANQNCIISLTSYF